MPNIKSSREKLRKIEDLPEIDLKRLVARLKSRHGGTLDLLAKVFRVRKPSLLAFSKQYRGHRNRGYADAY